MKKYNGRQNLKNHLVNTHLSFKDETKSENPLNNGETEKPDFEDLDPLTGLGDESNENGDNSIADVNRESADIQEVNIDSIKNKNESQNGHTISLNDSSDKENNFIEEGEKTHSDQTEDISVVKCPSKSKILTDREKELLGKMLNNLKKYGCAFCKER